MNDAAKINHRQDIDGLRAIAVLSVIAYHGFPNLVKGGYIGVDIFFVISGYVISSILFHDFINSSFTFKEFYKRRILRLFPALIVVLIFSLCFGWLTLLNDEFQRLGKHVLGASAFSSNFLLWNESGYFDVNAKSKLLLHLWSLGVEMQFYIFWPILLWICYRLKKSILILILIILALSFYANLTNIKSHNTISFYFPHARFWELLLGCALSYFVIFDPINSNNIKRIFSKFKDFQSLLGIFIIVLCIAFLPKNINFPGLWALLPTIGSLLIISAGPNAYINKMLLQSRLLVWIGSISYPLYLWHWPLLAFDYIILGENRSAWRLIGILILSLALAHLTYRYIETFFRNKFQSKIKSIYLSIILIFIGGIGAIIYINNGFESRKFNSEYLTNQKMVMNILPDEPKSHQECLNAYGIKGDILYCNLFGLGKPRVAVIGDSHARVLFDGMATDDTHFADGLVNIGGKPFLGVKLINEHNENTLNNFYSSLRGTSIAINESSISTVVIAYRAEEYLSSNSYRLIDRPEIEDPSDIFEASVRLTLDKLLQKNKNIILMISVPELGFDPRQCMSRPLQNLDKLKNPCAISRGDYELRSQLYRNLVFSIIKDYPTVKIFDAPAYLCDKEWCWAKKDGILLYRDDNHLSLEGARLIGSELRKTIQAFN